MAAQVSLSAGAYIQFANNATVASSGKLWSSFRATGAFLKGAIAAGTDVALDVFAASDLSAIKCGLAYWNAGSRFAIIDSTGSLIGLGNSSGTAFSALDDSTSYDVGWIVNDAATTGVTAIMVVYAAGDLWGTALGYVYTSAGSISIGTTAGQAVRFLGGLPSGHGFSSVAAIIDQAAVGDSSTNVFWNAPLEEGTGTSVSPSGTITGSYSWVGGADDPDHGDVTLDASTIALGGTTTAHVVWKDASNVALSPQPSYTWSVVSDSAAITVNATTGVITAVAAGTATVRATSGVKTATAEITITNPYLFTGTIA